MSKQRPANKQIVFKWLGRIQGLYFRLMVLSVPNRLRRSSLPLPLFYIKLSMLWIRIRMDLRTVIWLSRFRIQCCALITSVSHQCKEDKYYVKTSVVDPGCFSRSRIRFFFIPDPKFFHPESRIRIKEFKYFKMFFPIPDPTFFHPGSEIFPSRIADPHQRI
jgi:hypothetical protein